MRDKDSELKGCRQTKVIESVWIIVRSSNKAINDVICKTHLSVFYVSVVLIIPCNI